jgi:hypothetical protein
MAKVIINVTAKNIKEGRISDPHHCPISEAVRRRFPNVDRVDTGSEEVSAVYETFEAKASLPERAQSFIIQFDNGKKVKPFRFTTDFKYTIYPRRRK